MFKKAVLISMLSITLASPIYSQNAPARPENLGSYCYDLKYNGLVKEFYLGNVDLVLKEFKKEDFSAYRLNKFLDDKLDYILRDHKDLYTMKFGFQLTDTPVISSVLSYFYTNALFNSITTIENGRIRPLFYLSDLKNSSRELEFTFYDRENKMVEAYNNNYELISSNTYSQEIFSQILDPLSIINELLNTSPSINDRELFVGYFYNTKMSGNDKLFRVNLNLVNEMGVWSGEIKLPGGVFLKDSFFVRNEYELEKARLVSGVERKLFLKPVDGFTSHFGWAYTEIKE